jgi:hypothetical protein
MVVVPVPEALRHRIENPAFWTGPSEPTTESRELRVPFPVTGG